MASSANDKTLPAYQPPQTGFLSYLPATWVPYAELIRVTKPCGTYYFYYPFLFGTLFAACLSPATVRAFQSRVIIPSIKTRISRHTMGSGSLIPFARSVDFCREDAVLIPGGAQISPTNLLQTNITLFASAFMARNAACAWNDNLDVEYDRQVFRCRLRPIARGAITPLNGYIYAAVLFVLWVGIMATLPKPQLKYTIPYVFFNILYPLSKRFTYYTPACIGFTIAIGVFIGSGVLGLDAVELRAAGSGRAVAAMGCLYTATGTWTIVYEGTYSFQDLKDDLKAGVGLFFSERIFFPRNTIVETHSRVILLRNVHQPQLYSKQRTLIWNLAGYVPCGWTSTSCQAATFKHGGATVDVVNHHRGFNRCWSAVLCWGLRRNSSLISLHALERGSSKAGGLLVVVSRWSLVCRL